MSATAPLEFPHSHALRKGRASVPGQVYLVTTATHARTPLFRDFDTALLASRRLASPELWPDARLLAWVLMPDHMHLLVELGEKEPLTLVVQRVKSLTAISLRRELGPRMVWQANFHDHALRQFEDCRETARYIIANPVRAGLVEHVGDYPFWGCLWAEPGANPLDL